MARRLMIYALLLVVVGSAVWLYMRINPTEPTTHQVLIGTRVQSGESIQVIDAGTRFQKGQPLIVYARYAAPVASDERVTAQLRVTDTATHTLHQQEEWQEARDQRGFEMQLDNQTWPAGTYLVEFLRGDRVVAQQELVLE